MSSDLDALFTGMLATLKRTLHACPEPAGNEGRTAATITSFLGAYAPDQLLTGLGGHGVAAVYRGAAPGPTVLVRCELDAIPIEREDTGCNMEHRCGHDGHMVMVAGLAPLLHAGRPPSGRVVLLFQPAEETGDGAARVIRDPRFEQVRPDYAIALHNLPGYPEKAVVVRRGVFASASVGMKIVLRGAASHAAEPELALTPRRALASLLSTLPELGELPVVGQASDDYTMLTITHVHMGRASFGVTPGHAELFATLRAATSDPLDDLRLRAQNIVHDIANAENLRAEISWLDEFPETRNDAELVDRVAAVAAGLGLSVVHRDDPFRWSEDFGHFGRLCPSAFFGLGIGRVAPALHTPDYAFPDAVIPVGVQVLHGAAMSLLGFGHGTGYPNVA